MEKYKIPLALATGLGAAFAWYQYNKTTVEVDENKGTGFKPVLVSAPGKAILFGEHAVVHGRTAIAVALGLRTYTLIKPLENAAIKLKLTLPSLKLELTWTEQDLAKLDKHEFLKNIDVKNPSMSADFVASLKTLFPEKENAIEMKGTLAFLFLYYTLLRSQKNIGALHVEVNSYLPVGMGLGSSAAYSVALVGAFFALISNQTSPDLVNTWAFQAEKIMHGNPSGIDNSISTFGGTLTLTKDLSKGTVDLQPIKDIPSLQFFLVNTKVPRNTAELVKNVGVYISNNPEKGKEILDEIHSISKHCIQLFDSKVKNEIQDAEFYKNLESMIERNHQLLTDLGVGHKALDQVCQVTKKHQLMTKLTGAGGGGCALTLCPSSVKEETLKDAKEELELLGYQCFQTDIAGKGYLVHDMTTSGNVLKTLFPNFKI